MFLSSRELAWCELVWLVLPLWWWLVLFIVALVLFPNMSGKGSHNAGFERGQVVQYTLTKVVFACEKPLAVMLRWARR